MYLVTETTHKLKKYNFLDVCVETVEVETIFFTELNHLVNGIFVNFFYFDPTIISSCSSELNVQKMLLSESQLQAKIRQACFDVISLVKGVFQHHLGFHPSFRLYC